MKRTRFSRKNAVRVVSCSGKTIIRFAFVAVCAMVMSSCGELLKQHLNYYDYENDQLHQCYSPEQSDSTCYEFDGLYFSSENVIETFDFNNRVFYMVYDDIDAGIDMAIIRLDEETFRLIEAKCAHQNELEGTLKATRPFESVEYVLEVENS